MTYFRDNIEQVAGYTPGFQPKAADVVKLNTNENPFAPSPQAVRALRERTAGREGIDGLALAEAEQTLASLRRRELEDFSPRRQAQREARSLPPLPAAFPGGPAGRRSPSAAEVLVGIRNRAMMANRVA